MSDPLAGYEWDEDEPDDTPDTPDEQDDQDKGLQDLAKEVRDMKNEQKAKEASARAEAMRNKYLDSLPDNQKGLAVVGLAGAEDPKTMKSHIEKVQALLKDAFPDTTPAPAARADEEDDDDGPDPFAPIVEGTPAVPRPVDAGDRLRKDRLDRIFEEGDSQAALELYLADSPVFGDKGKYPIAKKKRR